MKEQWIKRARENTTHIISVCDTFNYDDYPVYVSKDENLAEIKAKYDNVNMQRINEIIKV